MAPLRGGKYTLYWATTAGVTPQNGQAIAKVNTPYVHTELTNGTRYYYLLQNVKVDGSTRNYPETSAQPGQRTWGTPETQGIFTDNGHLNLDSVWPKRLYPSVYPGYSDF